VKSAVTSRMVFAAKRRYRRNPSLRTLAASERLRKAYEDRFPNRRLNFFQERVELWGFGEWGSAP
jgi:hypothetical protein